MVGWFDEVCVEGGDKVSAGKSKVMILSGGEGLECEVYIDGIHLEHVPEYLGYDLNKLGSDGAECSRKVVSGRKVASTIRSLFNAGNLQPECARVLHKMLLVSILMYGRETMLWKE